MLIRTIDPESTDEINLVATRMRETLMEVLGENRGGIMYTDEWLQNRVRQHLDPAQFDGQVFLAENEEGEIIGHTIVRVEKDDYGKRFGLFSTFYVVPGAREQGVARSLVHTGESWMIERTLTIGRTYTAADNAKLHRLMVGLGYSIELRKEDMVVLAKRLDKG